MRLLAQNVHAGEGKLGTAVVDRGDVTLGVVVAVSPMAHQLDCVDQFSALEGRRKCGWSTFLQAPP